ncbi:hypothetical protein D9619_010129 [Psilocybe cf. subviscida]|uniref:Uncharacterized protein n=1 Tax=Psilocybe cf. subviscida TaxID=2480587 RepID=A0A8H5ERS6_9AGAR|nr:hypothetical protein D9619_010129 [Psilocybe cf. subviscida]
MPSIASIARTTHHSRHSFYFNMSSLIAPPVSDIRLTLDPYYNSMVIESLLCGIYTVILIRVICMCRSLMTSKVTHVITSTGDLHHQLRERKPYCCTLIILWMITIACFGMDWVYTHRLFVLSSNSPYEMASALSFGSYSIFMQLPKTLGPIVADGLLTWRCHMLWESRWIRSILLMLFTASAALGALGMALYDDNIKDSGLLITSQLLVSAVTTLFATFVIGFMIFLVTRRSHMHHSYRRVIEIVVQSAALISVPLVIGCILDFVSWYIPETVNTTGGLVRYEFNTYIDNIQATLLGIAPTLVALHVVNDPPRVERNTSNQGNPL